MTIELPVRHPFELKLTVTAEQVDVQARASNVAVLDWMIRAATDHSADLGWPHERYVEIGGMFVVRRHEIDYLRAAAEGDSITVYTWPSGLEKASAERTTFVVKGGDEIMATAITSWGFVDLDGSPQRIPEEVASTFDPSNFV